MEVNEGNYEIVYNRQQPTIYVGHCTSVLLIVVHQISYLLIYM